VDATGSLSHRPAALLRGLAIGDTSEIDPSTVDRFRDSGLAHLLAVSGSNVAIVLAAAAVTVRRSSPTMRAACAAGCLLLFVLVVGPEPSVLRAGAMGSLALVALVTGRTTEPLAALGVATAAVIVLRPEMVHSAGLHLSVAATAGIVLFGPRLGARLSMLPRPVAVVLGATLAAQVAVAPVVIGTFGELSLVAPLSNLVAAPAVAPATVLSLGAALLYSVWPPLGRLSMALAEPFGAWILWVADRTGSVPGAAVTVSRWVAIVVALPVGWFTVVAARRRVG
jgi:competence protein ComEC